MAVSETIWLHPPLKPKLSINDVHVWRVGRNQTDRRIQQLQEILSDDEGRRAERSPFDCDRRRFIVSHGMLRLIIGEYIEMEPSRLQFYAGHRGQPYLKHSLGNVTLDSPFAHSKEIALYAFTSNREIGIHNTKANPLSKKIAGERLAKVLLSIL